MYGQKLYSVVTLYDCMQDPATLAWLVHTNIALPGELPPGRYPTPSEIRKVIEGIPGLRTNYLIADCAWQATLTSREDICWASLQIKNYTGNPDEPHFFIFDSGWDEIILTVTSHLAKLCGPLVLLHDSGVAPQVVT